MRLNDHLNIKRIYLLIKKDIVIERKTAGIITLISGLLVMLAGFIASVNQGSSGFIYSFYFLILYTGGIIITSRIFSDMHSSTRNYLWYTLPASNLEKTLSRFLITSVLWPVSLIIIFMISSSLIGLININNPYFSFYFLNPFKLKLWRGIGYYILINSIFFYGGAAFKKHPLIKMMLLTSGFMVFLMLISFSILRMIAGQGLCGADIFQWNSGFHSSIKMYFDSSSMERLVNGIKYGFRIFFYFIMAPLFWFLTYLKVSKNNSANSI